MKINIRFIVMPLIAVLLAFSATGIQPEPVRANSTDSIIYVNRYSGGANDGSSWSNAFNKLQDALDAATSGDQIWVSWGVYYPDEGLNQTNDDRNSTFILKDGVEVYGGFEGSETLLSERDIDANPVILSGDIDENDVNIDTNHIAETTADIAGSNSYHVVFGGDATATTILDGFIITAGNADGLNLDNSSGGGLFNWGTSPTLNNLTFSGNYGFSGGGMYNYNTASPALTNVIFSGNQADNGGGMSNAFATPTMTNVTFENNTANLGGGVYSTGSSPTLENTTFLDNTAVSYGGGMFNTSSSHAVLTGVTFTGNGATTT